MLSVDSVFPRLHFAPLMFPPTMDPWITKWRVSTMEAKVLPNRRLFINLFLLHFAYSS